MEQGDLDGLFRDDEVLVEEFVDKRMVDRGMGGREGWNILMVKGMGGREEVRED